MNLIRTHGIVVGEMKTGEADKILTIFTRKQGMIRAVVKGACKNKSSMIACSQFLAFSDFIFYKGKNDLYKINTCEVVEPFYDLRIDIEKLTYASYATEIIKEVVHENMPSYKILQLFLNTIFAISNSTKPLELIIRSFELRLISMIGYRPNIEGCVSCGFNQDCLYFSFAKNGFICKECIENRDDYISLSLPTVNAIRYIITSDLKKLFSYTASEVVLKELKLLNEIYIKQKIEKEFKSLKILEKI